MGVFSYSFPHNCFYKGVDLPFIESTFRIALEKLLCGILP